MSTELAQGYLSLSVRFQSGAFKQLESAMASTQRASERTGRTIGRHLSAGSKSGASDVKANLNAAQSAFDRASKASQRAGEATEAAQRKATIATRETAEATRKYGADSLQTLKAQDREARATKALSEAKLKEASASEAASEAEKKLDAAKKASIGRTPRMLQPLKQSLANFKKTLPNPFEAMPRMAQTSAGRAVKTLNSHIGSGLSRVNATVHKAAGVASKAALAGAGAATAGAVAGVGFALKKGFGRLESIDNAKQKLLGLGNSAKDVDQIMQDATASVKGTSFGLEEAATTSAMMVATGIKPGKELAGTLRTVADTATIAGMSMGDAGKIFSSVAARGKLQGDDMMQLTSAGVPVLQALSKHLKKSQADVSNMVSKGQIDFKTFAAAMDDSLGGSAAKSGDTFAGSLKNMGASIGRMGAGLMQGAFPRLAPMFQDLTKSMAPLEEASKRVGERIGNLMAPAFDAIGRTLHGGAAVAGIGRLKDALGGLWDIIARNDFSGRFAKAFNVDEDAPIVNKLLGINEAFTRVVDSAKRIPDAMSAMWAGMQGQQTADTADPGQRQWVERGAQLQDGLQKLQGIAMPFLGSVKQAISGVWAVAGPIITGVVSGLAKVGQKVAEIAGATVLGVLVGGMKVLTPLLNSVGQFLQNHQDAVRMVAASLGSAALAIAGIGKIQGAVTVITGVATGFGKVFKALSGLKDVMAAIRLAMAANPITLIAGAVVGLGVAAVYAYNHFQGFHDGVNKVFGGIKSAAMAVGNWFSGPFVDFFKSMGSGAKSAFDGVKGAAQAVGNWFTGTFVGFFKKVGNGIKQVFDWIGQRFSDMWTGLTNSWGFQALQAVFSVLYRLIKLGFTMFTGFLLSTWRRVWSTISTVFSTVIGAILAVARRQMDFFKRVISVPLNWISNVWHAIWTRIRTGFTRIIGLIVAGARTSMGFLKTAISIPLNWIKQKWSDGWNHVKRTLSNVFESMKTAASKGVDHIKGVVSKGVDAISTTWDKIKDAAKKPVSFVVKTVINHGLVDNFNKVARHLGAKEMPRLEVKGLRTGGVVPGTFNPAHRDNVLGLSGAGVPTARVEPGEFVINRRQTARNLPLLHAINAGVAGYASGGLVGGSGRWTAVFQRRLEEAAAALGMTLQIAQRGFRPRTSWSGTSHRGDAVDVSGPNHGNDLWKIRDALRSRGVAAWVRGPKQGYSWHVHGIPLPGAGTAAGSAVYQQQAYRAGGDGLHGLTNSDIYATPGKGSWLGQIMSGVKSLAEAAWDGVKGAFDNLSSPMEWFTGKMSGMYQKVKGKFGNSTMVQLATAVPKKLASAAVDKIKSIFSAFKDKSTDGGIQGAGQNVKATENKEFWRPYVRQALAASGIGGGKADEDKWLRQIITESSGNPRLVQSSKVYDVNIARGDPARGLVQVPKVTWDDFGKGMGPFMPSVYDPLKNLVVGMRAANAQHHNWRRVIGFGHGYLRGGRVMADEWSPLSEDGRPELVVGPQMAQLAAGTKVFNADQTQQMMGWTRQPTTFNLYDRDDRLLGSMYGMAVDAIADHSDQLARMGAR